MSDSPPLMPCPPPPVDRELTSVLRRAVQRAGRGWASQPSRLRLCLQQEIGPAAARHRSEVHQLVVAVEERVPLTLAGAEGQRPTLGRVARSLAESRGWTLQAANWTVANWAAALGVEPQPDEQWMVEDRSPQVDIRPSQAEESGGAQPGPLEDHTVVVPRDHVSPLARPSLIEPVDDRTVVRAVSHEPPMDEPVPDPPAPAPTSAGFAAVDVDATIAAAPRQRPGVMPVADVAATDLPAVATSAPPLSAPPPGPGSPAAPRSGPPPHAAPHAAPVPAAVPSVALSDLPRSGTATPTGRASAVLGQPVEIAFAVRSGPSPVWMLPLVVVALGAVVAGGIVGDLVWLVCAFGILALVLASPYRVLALSGDQAWLLSTKGRLSTKPVAVVHHGPRSEITPAGGMLLPVVAFGGEQLRFYLPTTRAGRLLATGSGR